MQEIGISGVSGRFPDSPSFAALSASLQSGRDLVAPHSRWPCSSLPARMGQLTDLHLFDAPFFKLNPKTVAKHDPKLRKLLEVVYESIIDSGHNPQAFRGAKIAVFLAISPEPKSATNLEALSGAIMANMISFSFDFKGPSYALDTACSSGLYALNQAVNAMKAGECDAAVVCGAQTHFEPAHTKHLLDMGVLNMEGVARSFSSDRNGYVKSEAVVALLLQKRPDCRRIYACIAGVGTNVDGYKAEGINHPSSAMQQQLLAEIYAKSGVQPEQVKYVEAHGPGTIAGDKEEAKALAAFFGANRTGPLLVGSVKSNLGHTETASGLVSVTKVLIALNCGVIPANLHYASDPDDIPEFKAGKLKLNERNTPFEGGFVGVNSFGFGGANAHLILRPFPQRNQQQVVPNNRLVLVSGRSEESLAKCLDLVVANGRNPHFLALVNEVFKAPISEHPYRGYAILNEEASRRGMMKSNSRPEVWYCFSGMGSQWPGMAKSLVQIPLFYASIQKSSDILAPYGVDLLNLVTQGDWDTFNDLVNAFTSIVAISIALVDFLASAGVVPDVIIGHSLGEIACGYADGSISREQAVLIAYARGHITQTIPQAKSLMVSVGLSLDECEALISGGDVSIACENSKDNVTISGPETSVRALLRRLDAMQVFYKVVPTGNIAFHSPAMENGRQPLLHLLTKIIPVPKLRSKKWLSSSLEEADWGTRLGVHNSAEYHVHNYLNRVHFRQLLDMLPPNNAVVVEIAPRGLLQAILRRNAPESVRFALVDPTAGDRLAAFYDTIADMHLAGVRFDLTQLYPFGDFPVAVDTPNCGQLIGWEQHTWPLPAFNSAAAFGKEYIVDSERDEYLRDHKVNNKVVFPAAGYLVLAWRALADMMAKDVDSLPVTLAAIRLHQATFLREHQPTRLIVNVFQASGRFEITSATRTLLVSGVVRAGADEMLPLDVDIDASATISRAEFYKEYELRGYGYSGRFQCIDRARVDGKSALIQWQMNWTVFIDGLLQHMAFFEQEKLWLPTDIERLRIDPVAHADDLSGVKRVCYGDGVVQSGGVEIRRLDGKHVKKIEAEIRPTLQEYRFVPDLSGDDDKIGFRVAMGIVLDNLDDFQTPKIAVLGEVVHWLENAVSRNFNYNPKIETFNSREHYGLVVLEQDDDLLAVVRSTQFIIVINTIKVDFEQFGLVEVYRNQTKNGDLVLLGAKRHAIFEHEIITASNTHFDWIDALKAAIQKHSGKPHFRIYLFSSDPHSGLLGFYSSYRLEAAYCAHLRFIYAPNCDQFAPFSEFYKPQMAKDLRMNVFVNNSWGSFRLLPMHNPMPVLPTFSYLDSERSYIVIGGLGGVGFQFVGHLIALGATKIVINTRTPPKSGLVMYKVAKWRRNDVEIIIDVTDTRTFEGAKCVLELAEQLAPIGGIFNAVLVLKDGDFVQQTAANFSEVIAPKYTCMAHFDELTRDSTSLQHFVCFSSLVASVGNAQQTNYGFGNAAMERLCEQRAQNGRPGLAVKLGPVGDVGFVAQLATKFKFLNACNQPIKSCIDTIAFLMEKGYSGAVATCAFGDLSNVEEEKSDSVAQSVLNCFGLRNVYDLNDDTCLIDLGMDSLLSYEVSLLLAQEYGIKMDAKQVKRLKIADLKAMNTVSN